MRLAIAGSRSMLGRALGRRALAAGWQVAMVGSGDHADIPFDVRQPAPIHEALSGFDSLVICTASFCDASIDGLRENVQVNVLGALALFEAAAWAGVGQVIFVSSIFAVDPDTSYGLTKAMAESALRMAAAGSSVPLAIVRPAQIYDTAGEAARHQPFFYFLVDRIAAGQDVTLYGRKDAVRNYVHLDDVAEALFGCARERLGGVFNLVHPQDLAVSQIAATIREVFGGSSRIAFDHSKPDLVENAIPRDGGLFERLGVTPRPLAEGLAAIREHRAEAA